MSSFLTIPFRVNPSGDFYPNVEDGGGDDPPKYSAQVLIQSRGRMQSLVNKVSRGTARRTLGVNRWNLHIDTGQIPGELIVPSYGGKLITHPQAWLVSMTNIEGYGKAALDEFKCDMEWWIFGDITPAYT